MPALAQFRTLGCFALFLFWGGSSHAHATTPDRVLVVINDLSPLSRKIGEYYVSRRRVPSKNICHLHTAPLEEIERPIYERDIAVPVGDCLRKKGLIEDVYYIVLTADVPLKIMGSGGFTGDHASVDSELTLLYAELKGGKRHELAAGVPNPFFGKRNTPFRHPELPIYLVTRLAGYSFEDVKGMIDRPLAAANRGYFVIDLNGGRDRGGDEWLRNTAVFLPPERVKLDVTTQPVYDQTDVIGFASWGSNDANRSRRFTGFRWLPGAIVTEYVSTDGRTFQRPPDRWIPSSQWTNRLAYFANSPQGLAADYLREGATGASAHVYEPYLANTPRPDLLLPAYYSGRNLAESYYVAIPNLSWQNIVLGDPLCSLGKP
jgi:uncharacterized protein (TIGR03790 family)